MKEEIEIFKKLSLDNQLKKSIRTITKGFFLLIMFFYNMICQFFKGIFPFIRKHSIGVSIFLCVIIFVMGIKILILNGIRNAENDRYSKIHLNDMRQNDSLKSDDILYRSIAKHPKVIYKTITKTVYRNSKKDSL